ncbi:MAG: thiazole synthase, partial [Flavobacteriales bacterium]
MNGLNIGHRTFKSRLFVGTGKFSSNKLMKEAILASGSELVTVALKRLHFPKEKETDEGSNHDDMLDHLTHPDLLIVPNTSGARTAKEAILAAELAREALETNWLKLEIHPDQRYLMPDPIET